MLPATANGAPTPTPMTRKVPQKEAVADAG